MIATGLQPFVPLRLKQRSCEHLLFLFIVFVNAVDIVTSIYVVGGGGALTLGKIVKSVIFLTLLLTTLPLARRRPGLWYCYLLLGYFGAIELVVAARHQEPMFLAQGLAFSTKALLPFLAYYWLSDLKERGLLSVDGIRKALYLYVALFSMNIIVPTAFGVSFLNYTDSGYTGFYNAGNELGAFVTLMVPLMIYFSLTRSGARTLPVLLTLLLIVGGLLTGAKTPLLAAGLSLAFVPAIVWRRYVTGMVLVSIILVIPGIYVLNNLRILAGFLPANVFGKLIWVISERYSIWDVLLGVRRELFTKFVQEISSRSFWEILFGLGFSDSASFMMPIYGIDKAAEMDAVDLASRYGLVGLLLVFVLLAGVFVAHAAGRDVYSRVLIYTLALLASLSLVAGHVFGNAFCVFVLGLAFALNYKGSRSRPST